MKVWLRRLSVFLIIFTIALLFLAAVMYAIDFFYPEIGMQWAVIGCTAFSCGLYVAAHVQ